jgi:hypothetical protein
MVFPFPPLPAGFRWQFFPGKYFPGIVLRRAVIGLLGVNGGFGAGLSLFCLPPAEIRPASATAMATDALSQDEIALLGEEILMRECPGYAQKRAEFEAFEREMGLRGRECPGYAQLRADLEVESLWQEMRARKFPQPIHAPANAPSLRNDGFPWGKVILAAGLAVIGISIFRD